MATDSKEAVSTADRPLTVVYKAAASLVPDPRNARTHPKKQTARSQRRDELGIRKLRIVLIGLGVNTVLSTLGLGFKKFPRDEKRVRWEINQWAVEAALARLGDRQLTTAEQREVWNNSRSPHKVAWPDWWTEKGRS
ncbi:hypothetical protein [Erythrobacter alti]|uniref:hypothetical protein n=1 Tax=Erythrobacter alti TaxID=1896145 RepID=UPI0030F394BD